MWCSIVDRFTGNATLMTAMSSKIFAEQAARCFNMAAEATDENVARTLREMGEKLLELAHHDVAVTEAPEVQASTV
jgi:hypothetical protein